MADTARGSYRRYSDNEKAGILCILDVNRGNFEKTAKESGVPVNTLKSWAKGQGVNDETAEISAHKKADLATRLSGIVDKMVAALDDDDRISALGAVPLTISIGTLIDKIAFLRSDTALTREEAEAERQRLFQAVKVFVTDADTLDKIADEFARISSGDSGGFEGAEG